MADAKGSHPEGRGGRPFGRAGLAAIASYAAAALVLSHGAWLLHRPALLGDDMDAVQAAWFVGWVGFAVAHLRDPLVTTYLSPPGHPVGLMWNNAAPLLGLLLTPLTLARGAFVAYNVGIGGGLALSAWSAYLVIGRFTRRAGPAFIGGLVFGFSPWALSEASGGHLFLVNGWLIPVFFLLLVRVVARPPGTRWRVGTALGLVAAGQLLISQELFADAVLLGALTTIGLAIGTRATLRERLPSIGTGLLAAAAVFAATAAGPVAVALLGPGHGLHGRLQDPWTDVADVIAFVVPRGSQMLAPFGAAAVAARDGGYFGGAMYLGVPLLAIVAWAWWRYRADPVVRGSVLLTAAASVLAMGPALRVAGLATAISLPWRPLLSLPIYGLLMPARLGPFVFLGAAGALAVVLDRRWPARPDARVVRPALVAAAALLPLVPAGPLPIWIFVNPSFFAGRAVRSLPAGSLAVVGPATIAGRVQPVWNLDSMLWQVESRYRFRIPWGFVIQSGLGGRAAGSGPMGILETTWLRGVSAEPPPISAATAAGIRAELRRWRARAVVVGPMPNRRWAVEVVTAALGRPPRWTSGVALWSLGGRLPPSIGKRRE